MSFPLVGAHPRRMAALGCPLSADCGVSRRGVAKGKMGSVVCMGRKRSGAPDLRRPSSGNIHVPQVRGSSGPAANAPAKPPAKKEEQHTNDVFMAGLQRHAAQNSWAEPSGSKHAKGLTSNPMDDALVHAAGAGDVGTVLMLLFRNAKVRTEIRDADGLSALQAAAKNGHGEIVRCLVEAGAPMDARTADGDGVTALCLAFEQTHMKVVQLL